MKGWDRGLRRAGEKKEREGRPKTRSQRAGPVDSPHRGRLRGPGPTLTASQDPAAARPHSPVGAPLPLPAAASARDGSAPHVTRPSLARELPGWAAWLL